MLDLNLYYYGLNINYYARDNFLTRHPQSMAEPYMTHFSPLEALLLIGENPIPGSPKMIVGSFDYTILPGTI